jgi:hypothetical protein
VAWRGSGRSLTGHLIQESGERSPSSVIPSFVLIYTVLYPDQCTGLLAFSHDARDHFNLTFPLKPINALAIVLVRSFQIVEKVFTMQKKKMRRFNLFFLYSVSDLLP